MVSAAAAAAAAAPKLAARQQILARFPGPFSFCFAYGSGVKQQLGYADLNAPQPSAPHSPTSKSAAAAAAGSRSRSGTAPPMIDLFLCVDDTQLFHRHNMAANPDDYSSLAGMLGAGGVGRLQATGALGARVYFNPLVPLADGRMIKYGVVSSADLVDDLRDWRHLYVAGRLHKPVEVLQEPAGDRQLQQALRRNLESAVRAALLRLPESFGYFELFHAIANLSYAGDFRMYFGERRDKVRNIVAPQLLEFRALYERTLNELVLADVLQIDDDAGGDILRAARIVQDQSVAVTVQHVERLPAGLRQALGAGGVTELVRMAEQRPAELRRLLEQRTQRIVWNSSWGQSLKNVPTAGVGKAVRYSWQKVRKMFGV